MNNVTIGEHLKYENFHCQATTKVAQDNSNSRTDEIILLVELALQSIKNDDNKRIYTKVNIHVYEFYWSITLII